MTKDQLTTVIVEPEFGGHHFQAVGTVAELAHRFGPVVVLTSREGAASPALDVHLGRLVETGGLTVVGAFDEKFPPTSQLATVITRWCRDTEPGAEVGTIVLMDGDTALKRWWFLAPRHLRRLSRRPRVIFMLTRYPARLAFNDLTGWRLRGPKAVLVAAAMATRSLHRAVGFSGRDDAAVGWLVKRVRDPHYSSAHARDRDRWRGMHGLPAGRVLIGIFGAIGARKNAPLILDAIRAADLDADLLLAGGFDEEVRDWVDGLSPDDRARVIARDAFLDNDELDQLVAAVDVVPLALTNNGPSGIMGKADAAGVPVVTTGSRVRAREVRSTGSGVACEFSAESIGAAMRQVIDGSFQLPKDAGESRVTADEFAMTILGIDAEGRPLSRRRLRQARATIVRDSSEGPHR